MVETPYIQPSSPLILILYNPYVFLLYGILTMAPSWGRFGLQGSLDSPFWGGQPCGPVSGRRSSHLANLSFCRFLSDSTWLCMCFLEPTTREGFAPHWEDLAVAPSGLWRRHLRLLCGEVGVVVGLVLGEVQLLECARQIAIIPNPELRPSLVTSFELSRICSESHHVAFRSQLLGSIRNVGT